MLSSRNMNMNFSLTQKALEIILKGCPLECAILQILGYKRVPGGGTERFRLLVNDGSMLFSFAILATQLNHLIVDRKLEKYTIFKLNKYACTQAQPGKKIIICLDIEPLIPGSQVNRQIEYSYPEVIPCSKSSSLEKEHFVSLNNSVYSSSRNDVITQPSTSSGIIPLGRNIQKNFVSSKPLFTNSSEMQFESKSATLSYTENWDTKLDNRNSPVKQTSKMISVIPICDITPYTNNLIIKARVIYKTHIVNYSNLRKSGKFFSFYLKDTTSEIKAIVFDERVDELYSFIHLNHVYYISRPLVKLPKTASSCCYELNIVPSTKIELFTGDNSDMPYLNFNFIPFRQIVEHMNCYVDVIGICFDVSQIKNVTVKATNREVAKLDIQLIDEEQNVILLSLWGSDAENFDCQNHPVVAVKNAKVTDFNGCSLRVMQNGMVFINPHITEVNLLKSWFEKQDDIINPVRNSFNSLQDKQWTTIANINIEAFNDIDKANYYTIKATIVMVQKENSMYQACPSSDCFKKVLITSSGSYHCNKCNKEYDSFSWTLMLNLNLADFSSDLWAVAFRDTAESLVKFKTNELSMLKEQSEDKFFEILETLQFKSFIFKLRTRVETYNDNRRLMTSVLGAESIDHISYTKKLLIDISHMKRMLNA